MRTYLTALLLMVPGFSACLDEEGDVETGVASQEVVSTSSCTYVAPTCPPGWSLRVDFSGTRDMCLWTHVFGRQWGPVACPDDHPVHVLQPGADRCGLDSCSEY